MILNSAVQCCSSNFSGQICHDTFILCASYGRAWPLATTC